MNVHSFLLASLACAFFAPQDPSIGADPHAEQRSLARQRYQRVESELAGRDLANFSAEQREARRHVLELLHGYVERADFGLQLEQPLARVPKFVDDSGRRCAMAELLHATGEGALVAEVHAAHNEAWVADLSEDERFVRWLDDNGLSMFEAARIQGPAMTRRPVPQPKKPADTTGSRPTSPSGGRPSAPGAAAPAPAAPPGPGTVNGAPAANSLVFAAATVDSSSWWLWWEFNKQEFLRPNPLANGRAHDDGGAYASQLDLARQVLFPSLLRALDDPDSRVRSAAARAVGRIGGEPAVAPLIERMQDASLEVRDSVLLGLGATGAPPAQALLVELARSGRAEGVDDIGERGRALAIVALGLGRRAGFDGSVDDVVSKLLDKRTPSNRVRTGVAAMTYGLLAPSDTMTALARGLASDAEEPVLVRCRAIEALRGCHDAPTLGVLQHLASGSRLELRRSAALVLGEFANPLAAAGLMTAHDLEKESLTRCFALISLGRRGGQEARDYLLDVHAHGAAAERPWAALALGLAARAEPDARINAALRDGAADTRRADDRGAYWLALGLARDEEATPLLSGALEHEADAGVRMYAAQALALVRGVQAHAALRERAELERAPLARSQVALALGVLGEKGDVAPIARALDDASDPQLQGQLAAAIAFHGSSEALHCLGNELVRDGASSATRAAAIDGLGMLLGRVAPLSLGETARSSNFAVFDDWLTSAVATTL